MATRKTKVATPVADVVEEIKEIPVAEEPVEEIKPKKVKIDTVKESVVEAPVTVEPATKIYNKVDIARMLCEIDSCTGCKYDLAAKFYAKEDTVSLVALSKAIDSRKISNILNALY